MSESGEFRAVLPAVPENVATLRRFLAHTLVLCDSGANEADAALVLSELASNVLEHGRSEVFTLALRVQPEFVTIELTDRSRDDPVVLSPDGPADTGRGLRIVERLADEWGWRRPDDRHKVVWATLAAGSRRRLFT